MSFIAAEKMPSLPRAKFFTFRRVASVSCIVIGKSVSCVVCVLELGKLIEMSFAVLSV